MPLRELEIRWESVTPSHPLKAFIEDAEQRTKRFMQGSARVPSYIPSNFQAAAAVLKSIQAQGNLSGNRFCEWGSGLGVVVGLASMLGFNATGIELDAALHEEAVDFNRDYQLSSKLYQGSYMPDGAFNDNIDETRLEGTLGFSPYNFDLVYAFPWPAEEKMITELFERFAPTQAMLLTYQGGGKFRLRQQHSGQVV